MEAGGASCLAWAGQHAQARRGRADESGAEGLKSDTLLKVSEEG